MREQPDAGLGPVAVHPTHSGVGPRLARYPLLLVTEPNSVYGFIEHISAQVLLLTVARGG